MARPPLSPAESEAHFWAKVDRSGGAAECWPWTGARGRLGYGNVAVRGKHFRAHRRAYELLVGPIPEGLILDHLCRNPPCVNPAHLEPVTYRTNIRRGAIGMRTHCVHGHALDAANTWHDSDGHRHCKRCNALQARRWREAHPPT